MALTAISADPGSVPNSQLSITPAPGNTMPLKALHDV